MSNSLYIAYDPIYCHPLPEGHRFPMQKYALIPEQLILEGLITTENLFQPAACADDVVLYTHTAEYIAKLKDQTLSAKEQRQLGFPQSPALTKREWVIVQGTINCALHARKQGLGLNVAGGTHHAFADRGEGFCLLNDFAIAANYLLHQGLAKKILIIDLDVHQGNGTAAIFRHQSAVFTFSMHGRHNYPFQKEVSSCDLPLEDGCDDHTYLRLLHDNLLRILDDFMPDFCFYLSGVDILSTDKFGKLNISAAGCAERDRLVFSELSKRRLPVAVAMGGGYSPQLRDIVNAHCQTFREAARCY
ncbi:MAG: histone deacetylase [Bacteroidetes bacterium]|nr:histone deacetylase [Bacteroidota bacterium]